MKARTSTPSLRRHKPSSQGVVTLSGHDHYLGPWPEGQKSPPPEVQDTYDALVAEWLAGGRRAFSENAPPLTVEELILQFWERHVTVHYRHPNGDPTSEVDNFRLSLRPLRKLFGKLPAAEFSPLKLKAVREHLVTADVSRGVINQRTGRMKRLFRWAVAEELVPEPVYRALLAVEGLKMGRSAARETERILPVPDAHVEAALPFMAGPLRALVRIQRLTGMRPGEAAQMRGRDIDRTGEVWAYRPVRHKTAWRGKERVVLIGPRGQEILTPFLKADPDASVVASSVASSTPAGPTAFPSAHSAATISIEVVDEVTDPDTKDAIDFTDAAPYDYYFVDMDYAYDTGARVLPGTGTGPNPKRGVAVTEHGGQMVLEVVWSAQRKVIPPVVPRFQVPSKVASNFVPMRSRVGLPEVDIAADGRTPVYTIAGKYEYGILDPDQVNVVSAVPPFLTDTAAQAAKQTAGFNSDDVVWRFQGEGGGPNPFTAATTNSDPGNQVAKALGSLLAVAGIPSPPAFVEPEFDPEGAD